MTMEGTVDWPEAGLDPIRRLRLVEAALPGLGAAEAVIDVPFALVWSFVADLERSVPAFDPQVGRVQVEDRTRVEGGERLDLRAWARRAPVPLRFDVWLEEGFCLMRGRRRAFVVGMAARPEGDRTRFRHVEGTALPGARLLRPVFRRTARQDLAGIAREVAARPG